MLTVLALLLLAVGGVLATVARPTATITVSAAAGEAPLVLTAAGVLASHPGPVVVDARGQGAVLVAVGAPDDVAAWAEGAATTTVTGLQDDGGLATTAADGQGQVPDPADSDLWTAQARGQGSAGLTVDATAAASTAVLVAGDGSGPAPDLQLSWTHRPVPPAAGGLLGAGVLLALVALARSRRRVRAREPAVIDLRDLDGAACDGAACDGAACDGAACDGAACEPAGHGPDGAPPEAPPLRRRDRHRSRR